MLIREVCPQCKSPKYKKNGHCRNADSCVLSRPFHHDIALWIRSPRIASIRLSALTRISAVTPVHNFPPDILCCTCGFLRCTPWHVLRDGSRCDREYRTKHTKILHAILQRYAGQQAHAALPHRLPRTRGHFKPESRVTRVGRWRRHDPSTAEESVVLHTEVVWRQVACRRWEW